jgi:hypothetical protein
LLVGTLDLRRERPLADARDVCLGDADNPVDAVRPDPDTGRGVCGDSARGGHERIRPVVEVEQRALAALEQHVAPFVQGAVDEQRGIRDEGPQARGVRLVALGELVRARAGSTP